MKKSEKIRKRQAKAEEARRNLEQLKERLEWIIAHKDEVLADKKLYATYIPGCESGGAYIGTLPFTAGAMLECWDNCPEFTLPDGSKICQWAGSPLSGTLCGIAYDPATKELRNFRGLVGNNLTFATIIRAARPYMHKAKEINDKRQ